MSEKQIKICVCVVENETNVIVENIGKTDYLNRKIPILAGEQREITLDLAKHYFGNWEDHTFGEKQRQIGLNIHLLDVQIKKIKKEEKTSLNKSDEKQVFEKKSIEKEFEDLVEKEKNEEIKEKEEIEENKKICIGKTKAGKPCKAHATNGDYCGNHYPKE